MSPIKGFNRKQLVYLLEQEGIRCNEHQTDDMLRDDLATLYWGNEDAQAALWDREREARIAEG